MKQRSFSYILFIVLIVTALEGCSNVNANKGKSHNIVLNNIQKAEEFFTWSEDRIPMVSAHRGGRYYIGYAENTIEMFEYTISRVPAIIEFDVRRSKDGVLVLMHDETTGRTTTSDKSIEDLTLDEIRSLALIDYTGEEVIDKSSAIRGEHVYRDLIIGGADILSTDFPVEAYNAFKELIPEASSKSKFFK